MRGGLSRLVVPLKILLGKRQGGAMAYAAPCIGLRSALRRCMQRAAFFCQRAWMFLIKEVWDR